MDKTILVHEICQEIQVSVLMEKWFPNFFHTLINYKLTHQPEDIKEKLFPFVNLEGTILKELLLKIGYNESSIDADVAYILKVVRFLPSLISKLLQPRVVPKERRDYYYFDISGYEFRVNQLRIPIYFIKHLQTRFPKNSIDDIIQLILRFSMTSSYSWCSRSITNATTLMLPKKLHNYISSLADNCLECFSSVINTNTSNYCSIFMADRVFDGCQGPFMLPVLERCKPKLLFANPPYDNGTVDIMVDVLMKYHQNHKAMSIITINRKDGGLYDGVNERYDEEYYGGIIKMFSDVESKLLDVMVVPSYLMSYELVDNDDVKILGIKRDTMFIFYGDNILDISIHDLKLKMLTIIKDFRIEHTKKKRKIKYCNRMIRSGSIDRVITKFDLLRSFNFKRSVISNCRLLGQVFV